MDNIDDQFSLKWNNFQSNLATGFHDLLQEEMMVDVTLAAEGKFLQAHKLILSVCSPYFKDLFKVNPCKHPIVILKDVGHQEMADMLDFMYRGEANVRQEDLAAFLKLAETLKVKGLAGDKQGEDEAPPPSSQAPRKSSAPQVPKKKKIIETSVFDSDDHDPGESDYNPGGGEPRRKKRRSSPPLKTDSVMPSASSTSAQPTFPLANPKQEMPDPEEIQLIDDNDETNDPLVQLIAGQGTKQEHDHHDFDDSNFDNTLEDTGDGSHETDFDMSTAGPSNPDESGDQVPQGRRKYGLGDRKSDDDESEEAEEADDTEGTADFTFTHSQRGIPLLVHKGFVFVRNKTTQRKNLSYWRCNKKGCPATAKLQNNWLTIYKSKEHKHPTGEGEIRRRNVYQKVKNIAISTQARPGEIIEAILGEADEATKELVEAKLNHITQYIIASRYRHKRSAEAAVGLETRKSRIARTKQGVGVNYEMVPSQRGNGLLLYDGYTYSKNKVNDLGTRWICTEHRRGCKAIGHTSPAGWLTLVVKEHVHDRLSEEHILRKNYKLQVRNMALNSTETPSEIVEQVLPEDAKQDKLLYTRCIQKYRQRQRDKLLKELPGTSN